MRNRQGGTDKESRRTTNASEEPIVRGGDANKHLPPSKNSSRVIKIPRKREEVVIDGAALAVAMGDHEAREMLGTICVAWNAAVFCGVTCQQKGQARTACSYCQGECTFPVCDWSQLRCISSSPASVLAPNLNQNHIIFTRAAADRAAAAHPPPKGQPPDRRHPGQGDRRPARDGHQVPHRTPG